ncbi:hypothetical protein Vretimale_16804 [Volvox reticuliferus]|uniref:Peptidylprolyl isomerase n=1 Tax=Volvox reticuliferus TaxID=1737510 RepID=A0A8J4CVP9_9CHLO|nr:hypothetical protein Vretifemale_18509 [Volvox reticuliferus]GIM13777.1 hypothetical protein Vretimale_16804 [Volvox reticuliferus]
MRAFHVALFVGLANLGFCAGDLARQDAFITYSEVSRTKNERNTATVAAVSLMSTYGQIRLHLRRDWAPQACEAIAAMAAGSLRACAGCSFYRNEPVPQNWGLNGFNGPPYALLQGGLPGMTNKVKMENPKMLPVLRGTAAFIADTSDFFIGTADHREWGGAFTVFAEVLVEDMAAVVSHIPVEPYRNSTDSFNITTRWLTQPIPFTLEPLRLDEMPASALLRDEAAS